MKNSDKISKPSKKVGRPSGYTPELAKEICEAISSSSKGLRRLKKDFPNWPDVSTIMDYLDAHKEFAEQYARAREKQADYMADEIIEISDDSTGDTITNDEGRKSLDHEFAARSRLRVDARKWAASKLAPKKYGDKLDVVSDGKPIAGVVFEEVIINNSPPLANNENEISD